MMTDDRTEFYEVLARVTNVCAFIGPHVRCFIRSYMVDLLDCALFRPASIQCCDCEWSAKTTTTTARKYRREMIVLIYREQLFGASNLMPWNTHSLK